MIIINLKSIGEMYLWRNVKAANRPGPNQRAHQPEQEVCGCRVGHAPHERTLRPARHCANYNPRQWFSHVRNAMYDK